MKEEHLFIFLSVIWRVIGARENDNSSEALELTGIDDSQHSASRKETGKGKLNLNICDCLLVKFVKRAKKKKNKRNVLFLPRPT